MPRIPERLTNIPEKLKGQCSDIFGRVKVEFQSSREELGGFSSQIGNQAVILTTALKAVPGALRGKEEPRKTLRVIDQVIHEDPDDLAINARKKIKGRLEHTI